MKALYAGTKITIVCANCSKREIYITPCHATNKRKYCEKCAAIRKYKCIDYSNKTRSSTNVIGRPKIVEKFYGKDDARMGFDEPNYGGY